MKRTVLRCFLNMGRDGAERMWSGTSIEGGALAENAPSPKVHNLVRGGWVRLYSASSTRVSLESNVT